ncbi:hypothetical protein DMENIID0001_161270 [Sergentomyia squamirostris]
MSSATPFLCMIISRSSSYAIDGRRTEEEVEVAGISLSCGLLSPFAASLLELYGKVEKCAQQDMKHWEPPRLFFKRAHIFPLESEEGGDEEECKEKKLLMAMEHFVYIGRRKIEIFDTTAHFHVFLKLGKSSSENL